MNILLDISPQRMSKSRTLARASSGLLIIAVALAWVEVAFGAEPADADQPAPIKSVLVSKDLPSWQISLSVNPQAVRRLKFHRRPTVEIDNGGAVTIKTNEVASKVNDVKKQIEAAEARELFALLAETVNGFYFTQSPGRRYEPSHSNDIDMTCWYGARVTSGSRAVQLKLEQAEPFRMGLDSRFFSVVAGANRQLHNPQDRFPEPLRLDASYRDPEIDVARSVVPERQSDEWRVTLRIRSDNQNVELTFNHRGAGHLGIVVDKEYERHDDVKANVSSVFYDCARVIMNQFELTGNPNPNGENAQGARIELSVGQQLRSISVEFDSTDIPAEWRQNLESVVGIANEHIPAGKNKIIPLSRALRR